MPSSLIEELPKIIAKGKKEAQRILDGISEKHRVTLQTNELVLPTKAKSGLSMFTGQSVKELKKSEWFKTSTNDFKRNFRLYNDGDWCFHAS